MFFPVIAFLKISLIITLDRVFILAVVITEVVEAVEDYGRFLRVHNGVSDTMGSKVSACERSVMIQSISVFEFPCTGVGI